MVMHFILCLVGFVLLYYGADWLVKGSSSLARSLGVTPIVIGLTVVAFGTSTPELLVSLVSAVKSKSMIAIGNVVGSNICNIALVLATAALFHPIVSHRSVVSRDIPIMLGVSLLVLLFSVNSRLGRLEGVILFGGVLLYTFMNYYWSRKDQCEAKDERACVLADEVKAVGIIDSRPKQLAMIILGTAGVIGGADLVVDSAVVIMTMLGVSEKFIGLTIVAFGTSLPELATSVVAAIRKEMDISIGNLVGSNVFNLLSVLGIAAMVRPIPITGGFFGSGLWLDYLVMLIFSAMPLVLMRKTATMSRSGGGVLLGGYVLYLVYLIAKA